MALSSYHGEHDIQRQMNKIFDDFFGGFPGNSGALSQGSTSDNNALWRPRVDVSEDDKNISVHAELPGIPKENVTIDVTNNVLSIVGERKETKEQKDSQRQIRECHYGHFRRQIGLPPHCNVDQINAKFENGVLEIVVPKGVAANTKRIEIK